MATSWICEEIRHCKTFLNIVNCVSIINVENFKNNLSAKSITVNVDRVEFKEKNTANSYQLFWSQWYNPGWSFDAPER